MIHSSRASTWIENLEHLQRTLDTEYSQLELCEFALVLRSFLRQLSKQPESVAATVMHVEVPLGESGTMKLSELLEDMPRDGLHRALDLILKYNGDIDAAIKSEVD